MGWKNISQQSLADGLMYHHEAIEELDGVHGLIDWSRLEVLLSDLYPSRLGEKAWPPLLMFKALLLQSGYKLSDPALEKQLARDLMFRRFVGLGVSDGVPDHSSLWRARNRLQEGQRLASLLAEINNQLSEQGLIIRQGAVSIIDASVIQAKQCRPNRSADGQSTQDPEAGWNVKAGSDGKRRSTYGFKAHMNADEDGFIQRGHISAGNEHDSQHFEPLLTGEEHSVYADSAYKSAERDLWLEKQGIDNRITERAWRNRPLTAEQKQHNQNHNGTRSTIERVFGVLKQHYGMGKARYLGLERNQARLMIMSMGYNLKRGYAIEQACAA